MRTRVARRRRRFLAGLALLVALVMGLLSASLPGATAINYFAPRTVLMVGDSLTAESRLLFSKATWSIKVDAIPGSAPCDWLAGSHPNLVDYLSRRPAYLFIEAAGNNTTKCMRWPNGARVQHGSAELVRRYEAALTKIFDIAAHNDVRIVYVAPPPMYYREADIDNMKIADWVAHGPGHPGVIESDLPRLALSRDGHPSVFLRCEPNEGAKVGCYLDAIAVRQIDDPLHVHFCPFRKDVVAGFLCGVYSSGEHRWADAVDKLII